MLVTAGSEACHQAAEGKDNGHEVNRGTVGPSCQAHTAIKTLVNQLLASEILVYYDLTALLDAYNPLHWFITGQRDIDNIGARAYQKLSRRNLFHQMLVECDLCAFRLGPYADRAHFSGAVALPKELLEFADVANVVSISQRAERGAVLETLTSNQCGGRGFLQIPGFAHYDGVGPFLHGKLGRCDSACVLAVEHDFGARGIAVDHDDRIAGGKLEHDKRFAGRLNVDAPNFGCVTGLARPDHVLSGRQAGQTEWSHPRGIALAVDLNLRTLRIGIDLNRARDHHRDDRTFCRLRRAALNLANRNLRLRI